VGLDLGAIPNVLTGKKWHEGRMNGRDWNQFLEQEGFVERYGKEAVDPLRAPDEDLDGSRVPFVVLPNDNARGIVVNSLNLIFPLGFLMIGLRLLLRALLVLSGHLSAEQEDSEAPSQSKAKEAA